MVTFNDIYVDFSVLNQHKLLHFVTFMLIFRMKSLKKRRKYVVVIIFAAAALLTPPDPITQIGLAIPLLILYELSIFSVKLIENKSEIELLAIGIGHDVSRYYNKAIKITDVQELGDVMIKELSGLFYNKKKLH